ILPVLAERTYTTLDLVEPFPTDCEEPLTLQGHYRSSIGRTVFRRGCFIEAHDAVVELHKGRMLMNGELSLKGNLTFIATTPTDGTCVTLEGSLTITDGSLTILGCNNTDDEGGPQGGALRVKETANLTRAQLVIRNSTLPRLIPDMRREAATTTTTPNPSFVRKERQKKNRNYMTKPSHGGCAYFAGSLELHQASAVFEDCQADVGGCVRISGDIVMDQSELRFRSCSAERGGALFMGEHAPSWDAPPGIDGGSLLQARSLTAPSEMLPKARSGKGPRRQASWITGPSVASKTVFRSTGGTLSMEGCQAAGDGAGIFVFKGNLQSNATDMLFENCSSGAFGGAIFAGGSTLRQISGSLQFRQNKAVRGGSLYVRKLKQDGGSMSFFNSTAEKTGGAVQTERYKGSGQLLFKACTAGSLGGAIQIYSKEAAEENSISSSGLIRCSETYGLMGGCVASIGRGSVELNEFELHHAASQVLGNLAYVRGAFGAKRVSVDDSVIRIDAAIVGLNSSRVDYLDCSETPACHLRAVNLTMGPAKCSPGSGVGSKLAAGETFRGCFRCDDGQAQLKTETNVTCQKCPYEAFICDPNMTQLEHGVMANPDNFSRILHCPNAQSCPGGRLPETTEYPMCEVGYEGDGCASCNTTFGRSDSSVLVCVKCANGWFEEGLQLMYFLLSDTLLLAVATSSVLGASATRQDSGVLLNQLLSFATVTQTVLSAMVQTAAYKMLSSSLRSCLDVSSFISGMAQGESSWTMSRECLLASLGLPKTVWHVHLLGSLLQGLLLVVLIGRQGFWFAFVVWTNCFAPSIAASFGRYLVGYRLEPESVGGVLHYPFLPPIPHARETVLSMLGLSFLLTAGGWWMASNSKRSPAPDYVVFLVRNYKLQYRNWEIERLVRKMLLRLVTAALPISYSPALQMWCVCLILSGSLMSYSLQQPYLEKTWNQVETTLLSIALVLAFSASAVLANEKHWGSSFDTQVFVLLAMAVLATGTTLTLSTFVAKRLYEERIQKRFASQAAES
ncbi:pmpB, partial [Symbiodinium sp. CCMP2456]